MVTQGIFDILMTDRYSCYFALIILVAKSPVSVTMHATLYAQYLAHISLRTMSCIHMMHIYCIHITYTFIMLNKHFQMHSNDSQMYFFILEFPGCCKIRGSCCEIFASPIQRRVPQRISIDSAHKRHKITNSVVEFPVKEVKFEVGWGTSKHVNIAFNWF